MTAELWLNKEKFVGAKSS